MGKLPVALMAGLVMLVFGCKSREADVEQSPRGQPITQYGQDVANAKEIGTKLEDRDKEIAGQADEMFEQ